MLAPTARDAAMARSVLADAGFAPAVFEAFEELADAVREGAGAVLLMEEFFASEDAGRLLEVLSRQPAWSNLPLLVLASGRVHLSRAGTVLKSLPNVVLLERPVRIVPLVSALKAALAARQRQYEIRDYIEQLKRTVEERDRLYAAAEEARAEAEAANRMKDDFLATLSHELRTPLNAILGWSRLLKGGRLKPADVDEGHAVIERNARALVRLVEDLLDVSRIAAGTLRLEVQPVDLVEVVEAALAAVLPAAEAKGVRIDTALDALAGPVTGDPARLQQVVWNLLSNAVKFTPEGGRVRVLLGRDGSHAVLSVRDTGRGIRPEFLPRVFDRFRQADASTTRRHGGLGLGLSIVKQLVEMHGGGVRAESPGEDRGSTFTVTLPLMVGPSPGRPAGNPPGGCGAVRARGPVGRPGGREGPGRRRRAGREGPAPEDARGLPGGGPRGRVGRRGVGRPGRLHARHPRQ
jgi:signal transduction histidine kinase